MCFLCMETIKNCLPCIMGLSIDDHMTNREINSSSLSSLFFEQQRQCLITAMAIVLIFIKSDFFLNHFHIPLIHGTIYAYFVC